MDKTSQNVYLFLCVLAVVLVPFLSMEEIEALITGGIRRNRHILTSFWIKILKDLIFFLMVLWFVNTLFRGGRFVRFWVFYAVAIAVPAVISVALSVTQHWTVLVSGARWLLPLVFPLMLRDVVDRAFLNRIAFFLLILFFVHFGLQCYQVFNSYGWFGVGAGGLSARNPGSFLIPSTGAFFSATVFVFIVWYSDLRLAIKVCVSLLMIVSQVLTGSGTGLFVAAGLIGILITPRKLLLVLPIFAVPMIWLLWESIDLFFYRGTVGLADSILMRMEIFTEELSNWKLFSDRFGVGTNTAVHFWRGEIVDSWYASVLFNLGLVGLVSVSAGLILLISHALLTASKPAFALLFLLCGFSATTIWSEAFPMNLLIPIMAAYSIREVTRSQDCSESGSRGEIVRFPQMASASAH